jgi:hypothetical protein
VFPHLVFVYLCVAVSTGPPCFVYVHLPYAHANSAPVLSYLNFTALLPVLDTLILAYSRSFTLLPFFSLMPTHIFVL